MNVYLNQTLFELPENATISDALALFAARPPFAVAVNTQFVPQSRHAHTVLHEGDHVEVISPVTGG
ncbi:MAG: sulfur carrier protein ThiS [Burkholderiaceae bacterium]|jgi:sulfur carrier protein